MGWVIFGVILALVLLAVIDVAGSGGGEG